MKENTKTVSFADPSRALMQPVIDQTGPLELTVRKMTVKLRGKNYEIDDTEVEITPMDGMDDVHAYIVAEPGTSTAEVWVDQTNHSTSMPLQAKKFLKQGQFAQRLFSMDVPADAKNLDGARMNVVFISNSTDDVDARKARNEKSALNRRNSKAYVDKKRSDDATAAAEKAVSPTKNPFMKPEPRPMPKAIMDLLGRLKKKGKPS